ncbi:Sphingoid long-chain base transporter RSB1-like protein 9 [Colletotrichum chlorophyti]|uniref:Sphingoid long-chain base transporter RSB1-like protein 9 n=1 Tax=Colletotrichum chlorophyti TaxID=708187 RepID=A0A1Q8RD60_9PEZI|nr:Sphingoid long-chain base transporter RSB1-like protein 9 [Colletotrichum chlorophyti]
MTGDCTGHTCPFPEGFLQYSPSVVGSALFLVAFALLVPLVIYQGHRFKTPLFALTLTAGLLLEVLGFAGRVTLRENVASGTSYSLFLLGTILGPTLVATAICQVLPHVVVLYGLGVGFTRPRVAVLFLVFSLALVVALEIAGVVSAVLGLGGVQTTSILLAGLGIQIAALLLFVGLYFWYTQKIPDPKHVAVYQADRFKKFVKAMPAVAVVLIGHTIYRLVEFWEGLGGPLARSEAASLVISGVLPLLVCMILCIFHPGAAFGRAWGLTSPRFRSRPFRSRRQAPSPLRSPTAPWDEHKGPRQPGFTASRFPDKKMSPVGIGPVPLRESTMASKVAGSPGERSVTYPSPIASTYKLSPIASTHKHSPTFQKTQQQSAGGSANRNSKRMSKPMVNSEELW